MMIVVVMIMIDGDGHDNNNDATTRWVISINFEVYDMKRE